MALVALTRPASGQVADTALVEIGRDAAATRAFVAWPAGKGPFPGVVVVQEWWGLESSIKEVARRLAREGYAAIVPDLYHGEIAVDAERAHELSRSLESKRALADLVAAAAWMRAEPRVGQKKLAVMGFCMGGGLAQELALADPGLAAVVVFYGTPVTETARLARLRAPLQAHFGEADRGITVDRVEAFRQALRRAGKPAEVHLYAGAGHAFMNDQRPSFHPDAAKQAWARTLAFLHKRVKR
jgi:carboxymethylenebutenolidase